MANATGNAYGLTLLCPIRIKDATLSYSTITQERLANLPRYDRSPFAKVPNTYLCRLYVLNDVFYQGHPAREEHLTSKYLVFCCNLHGKLEPYLEQMWNAITSEIKHIWEYCVGFNEVTDAASFITYIKKCQVYNNLFFNGSTDEALVDQLKSLYLKQEFSRFAYSVQGKSAEELQQAFKEFVARTAPANNVSPSWYPGMAREQAGYTYQTPASETSEEIHDLLSVSEKELVLP